MAKNVIELLNKFLEDHEIRLEQFCEFDYDKILLNDTIFENLIQVRRERSGSDFDVEILTFYLPKIDSYIETEGYYYSSWSGTDWDEEFYEVLKETRMVEETIYKKILNGKLKR